MAIKSSGNLSMLNDIVAEFGGSEPHKISDYYSEGTLPTTGYITFSDFYGQSGRATVNITLSSNTNNYNIYSNRGGSYVAGSTDVTLTINSGVTIGSTSTGSYALDTGSGWTSGDTITIVNSGTVKGRGANGGNGGSVVFNGSISGGGNGGTGGPAFRAQFACTFTNNGSVYGGGGGGGGGGSQYGVLAIGKDTSNITTHGHGGGGGAGVNGGSGGSGGTGSGGTGDPDTGNSGSSGSSTAGGAGGSGDGGLAGGAGGGLGSNGSSGTNPSASLSSPTASRNGGSGGTRGFYQVGSANINSGSGIGGTVGGRSS